MPGTYVEGWLPFRVALTALLDNELDLLATRKPEAKRIVRKAKCEWTLGDVMRNFKREQSHILSA